MFFHGNSDLLDGPFITVIGAREARAWVYEWMENELASLIQSHNIGVVSGGARGIDQWAHALAIRKGGSTVVVLPSGLGKIYPKKIASWQSHPKVLFLSEYEHDCEMRKHFFYSRNRLIAGMTPLLLVVQAAEKSGTMMTAQKALDLGVTVATLPGSPVDAGFAGNNQLLHDGAQLVRNKMDLQFLIESEVLK